MLTIVIYTASYPAADPADALRDDLPRIAAAVAGDLDNGLLDGDVTDTANECIGYWTLDN
jgi:hypothetical protein